MLGTVQIKILKRRQLEGLQRRFSDDFVLNQLLYVYLVLNFRGQFVHVPLPNSISPVYRHTWLFGDDLIIERLLGSHITRLCDDRVEVAGEEALVCTIDTATAYFHLIIASLETVASGHTTSAIIKSLRIYDVFRENLPPEAQSSFLRQLQRTAYALESLIKTVFDWVFPM